jgi:hypothetical protein
VIAKWLWSAVQAGAAFLLGHARLIYPACLRAWPCPSRCSLSFHRRYVLANIETKVGVRRGERVWQIAFGSGFKCNSAVWRALRPVSTRHEAWLEDGSPAAASSPKA